MSHHRLPIIGIVEDTAICRQCGGSCCKSMPGILAPEDVGAPDVDAMRRTLARLFLSGSYAIDWWEGDPRPDGDLDSVEYVRPAVRGHEGQLRHPSWGGRCTLHREDGCALPYHERPHNCRALKPNPKAIAPAGEREPCKLPDELGKVEYVLAWLPYQSLLDEFRTDWLGDMAS